MAWGTFSAPRKQLQTKAAACAIQGEVSTQAGCRAWRCHLLSACFRSVEDARVKELDIQRIEVRQHAAGESPHEDPETSGGPEKPLCEVVKMKPGIC